jgi:hypothetical protein
MSVINFPELVKIGNSLETSLKALKKMQETIESTWPVSPVGEYFQILVAVARVNEALERLQRIIGPGKESC